MINQLLKVEPEHKRSLKKKIQYEEELLHSMKINPNANAAGYVSYTFNYFNF